MILGHDFLKGSGIVDPEYSDSIREAGIDLRLQEDLQIYPLEFVTPITDEIVSMPNDCIGFCNLRSTWARKGLIIPPTIIDPGFRGRVVIEIVNVSKEPIFLKLGTRFLHLIVSKCDGAIPYVGIYQGQYLGDEEKNG